jgi:hypothetical protein
MMESLHGDDPGQKGRDFGPARIDPRLWSLGKMPGHQQDPKMSWVYPFSLFNASFGVLWRVFLELKGVKVEEKRMGIG